MNERKRRKNEQGRMLLKSSILARPGWSPLNFNLLLGEPDERRHNYRRPSEMCFYALERVLAAEASPQFQEIKQKVKAKRFNVPRGLVLLDNDFAAALVEMPIEVIIFTIGRVRLGPLDTTMLLNRRIFLRGVATVIC